MPNRRERRFEARKAGRTKPAGFTAAWENDPGLRRLEVEGTPPPPVDVHKPALSPSRLRRVSRGRLAGAALVAGGVGGAAYLIHRRRRANVAKYFDPFQGEYVEVAKADGAWAGPGMRQAQRNGPRPSFPVAWPPQRSVLGSPRTPQGRYVSHKNDLLVVRNRPKRRTDGRLLTVHRGSGPSAVGTMSKSDGFYGGLDMTPAVSHNGVYASANARGAYIEDVAKGLGKDIGTYMAVRQAAKAKQAGRLERVLRPYGRRNPGNLINRGSSPEAAAAFRQRLAHNARSY